MRRPHRTIETFDISLMAVVTKAMGAFLVLMLLLMPYYTPGLPGQAAQRLLKELQEASAKLDSISKKVDQSGGQGLEKDAQALAQEVNSTADLLTKLEGLINKAFAEVARLEKENEDLKAQLAEIKRELANLQAQTGTSDRAVYVNLSSSGCQDVLFKALILRVGDEMGRTFTQTQEPVPPELVLYASTEVGRGRDLAETVIQPVPELADQGAFKKYVKYPNANFVAVWTDVVYGEYVVILKKADFKATWKAPQFKWAWNLLHKSAADCEVLFNSTSKVDDKWLADYPRGVVFNAEAIMGIPIAFTSDVAGIRFRSPGAAELTWFAELSAKALNMQNATPEGKAWLEAEQKRVQEQEENAKRDREKAEAERKAEDAKRAEALKAEQARREEELKKAQDKTSGGADPAKADGEADKPRQEQPAAPPDAPK